MTKAENAVERLVELHPLLRRNLMDLDHAGKRGELTGAHIGILFILRHRGRQKMGDLCDQTTFARPHMTALVDRIIDLGMAKRETGLEDRRQVYVTITEGGVKYLDDMLDDMKRDMAERLSVLPEDDLNRLIDSIETMVSVLRKMQAPLGYQ